MVKDSGIQAIDTDLINMKNVIDGSEDDIRNEVTKAGGFASDSQVLALTNSRNKQLIKNYNTLLETRNSKEKYLSTMIGLESQDRQAADQRFDRMMNFGMQALDYRDKMQQNAVNSYEKIIGQVGYDGLAQMVGGDPYYTNMIEQTLGLGRGGLQRLASLPPSEEEKLRMEILRNQAVTTAPGYGQGNGDRMLSLDEATKYGLPVGTKLSDLTGKTLGGGSMVSPEVQKENDQDFQFVKQTRDNVVNILQKATGKTDVSSLTETDMKKLTDADALIVSKALSVASNPKATRATGGEDALGPTGWLQSL